MAVENKQTGIIQELIRRIEEGIYTDRLPTGLTLAKEFDVNFKTMNRAIIKMAEMGLVTRQAKKGTFIVKEKSNLEDTLIELLFVGSSDPGNHPFYGPMWQGILDSLDGTIYRLVLNRLEENTEVGGLLEPCNAFTPSAGKILVGTSSPQQIKLLARQKSPFVLAGSKAADPNVFCSYVDIASAIIDAVRTLRKNNIKDIAYIGITRDNGELLLDLEKFHAYIAAVQEHGDLDSQLVEHAPPFAATGYAAMKKILDRKQPQAVLVAFDHLCSGVYQAIEEAGLKVGEDVIVIGLDGTSPLLVPPLISISVNLYEVGKNAGRLLLDLIRTPSKRRNFHNVLTAIFHLEPGLEYSKLHRH